MRAGRTQRSAQDPPQNAERVWPGPQWIQTSHGLATQTTVIVHASLQSPGRACGLIWGGTLYLVAIENPALYPRIARRGPLCHLQPDALVARASQNSRGNGVGSGIGELWFVGLRPICISPSLGALGVRCNSKCAANQRICHWTTGDRSHSAENLDCDRRRATLVAPVRGARHMRIAAPSGPAESNRIPADAMRAVHRVEELALAAPYETAPPSRATSRFRRHGVARPGGAEKW